MPCSAGELCKLPDVELIAPNERDCGHECRGGCGGKLHGICGEVEDPDGDSLTHRICHTCISNRNLSNPAKRKHGQGFVLPRASKNKSGASGAKKPRKRLNLGEKLEVLALLDKKVELGEQEEVVKALSADTEAVLMEKMNHKFTVDSDFDEEEEHNNTEEVESAGGRRLMAPPLYSDLSGFFGPLELFAQSAGNTEAGHFLRKAKMSFLSAYAAKPAR